MGARIALHRRHFHSVRPRGLANKPVDAAIAGFLSSLVFSWLHEARNFMPLTAVLTVLTVYHLVPGERAEPGGRQVVANSGVRPIGSARRGLKR